MGGGNGCKSAMKRERANAKAAALKGGNSQSKIVSLINLGNPNYVPH